MNTINDKGVTADTDRLRELALEDMVLTRRERELADERTSWRVKDAETRSHLTKARVMSCVVPFTHRSATSRMGRRCPAGALHTRYYVDDWGYDGEDTTYDDYDWEA